VIAAELFTTVYLLYISSDVCVCVCVCLFVCDTADRPAVYFVQQPPSDVIGHVGGSVYINCSARSWDLGQVKVKWVKDGEDAVEGNDRRSVTESSALVIAPVMGGGGVVGGLDVRSDDGVYVCLASYGSATIVSSPVTLHIAGLSQTLHTSFMTPLHGGSK